MAILPLRSIYDVCALWLIPQTQQQMLLLTILSWISMYFITGTGPGSAAVLPFLFLPALLMIFWNQHQKRQDCASQREQERPHG